MIHPKILVTGATGRTGAVVVSELLKAGHPVRAMVRHDDARAAALRARGVEIAVAEITDYERVAAAMHGVQRAYWLPPWDPAMLPGAAVFAAAAREARLEAIVSMTQWLASASHPAPLTRQIWLGDRIFSMLPDVAHTIVRPGLFADVPYLTTIGLCAHLGMMPWLFGDGMDAPPSVEDIGRVVAAALRDPQTHGGRTYRPTGPILLSGADMAAVLSRVLGRTVRLLPTPLRLFLKAAYRDGQPIALLSFMEHYIQEQRRGTFALGAPTADVERVTGQPAESFESVARRHAALPANRRSASASLRELARFMLVPLSRGPDTRGYVRGLQITAPAAAQYSCDSPAWRREHGIAETHAGPDGEKPGMLSTAA
jgi:uncharacterized protein YbjT (DUF2867 family)